MAINRTQTLVLGFFALAWASLVALFAAAPEVYGRAEPTWKFFDRETVGMSVG